ncbi:hypothetical protein, partial [Endozoicomonas sp. SESOKO4]|uniref:hypothetical protein n=1 Tax=Endozoicomonas sp. SESOKO4 TaxID=2828745 RepID=UPI002148C737
MHVLVFVPFVCPVGPQTYRFIVEVNQNGASTSITSTNGYSGSGMPPDDKPGRRNKLQIITLMYGTGCGN